MTTVPETAVAGGLVAGGVLLAMVMFSAGHYSLWPQGTTWPQPNNQQSTTVTCPNGNVLQTDKRLCHKVPFGSVDIHLDIRDAVTIPAGENGELEVITGAISIDNGGTFFPPQLVRINPNNNIRAIQPNTFLQFRPD